MDFKVLKDELWADQLIEFLNVDDANKWLIQSLTDKTIRGANLWMSIPRQDSVVYIIKYQKLIEQEGD